MAVVASTVDDSAELLGAGAAAVDFLSPFQRSDGLVELVKAAVCEPVRDALRSRIAGPDADADALVPLLRALATPPRLVSLRFTAAEAPNGTVLPIEANLERWLEENTGGTLLGNGCCFKAVRLDELSGPQRWLNIPEARAVVCRRRNVAAAANSAADGDEPICSQSVVGNVADIIIDAACGMAMLRGADVFCMGVMAVSAGLQKGQAVRLWVLPEGARVPCRGTLLEGPPVAPAVLVAAGETTMSRTAIFTLGAKGVAIRITRRIGATAPLAPMNDVLSDEALRGSIVLQQLPSCIAVRTLGVRPGHSVLDMCAAPGGKTSHLAQLLGEGGAGLTAVDRSASRMRRVEELCTLHGFHAVRCIAADSRHLCRASSSVSSVSAEKGAPSSEVAVAAKDGEVAIDAKEEEEVPIAAAAGGDAELAATEGCGDVEAVWPPEAERAFNEAFAEYGTSRFRGHKRIWKAVHAVSGGTVSRLQVQSRLRQVTNSAAGYNTANGSSGGTRATANDKEALFEPGSLDRVLVDAPCTALGQCPLFRWGKTLEEVKDHAVYQRHFLRTASDLLRVGGEVVYSTCSITAEENEENVAWALSELPLELLDARERALVSDPHGTAVGEDGPPCLSGLSNCGLDEEQRAKVLRFDPRHWDVGFFVALFRRRC